MPVAAEVAAFQGEVGGYEDVVAGGRAEDGTVVADAEADEAAGATGSVAEGLDELEFACGHESEDTGVERTAEDGSEKASSLGRVHP
jgi:hypothetical protein